MLRLVNCDLKSISYLSSQLPLLKDSQWDAEKQYKVASNVYPNEASEHIERVLGNVAFQIPHSEEVKAQVLEGNLLKELVLKDSKGFRKTMEAIHKGGVRMLGERRSKACVFCGFSRSCSGRNTTGFWTSYGGDQETEASLDGLDGGEGIEENFQNDSLSEQACEGQMHGKEDIWSEEEDIEAPLCTQKTGGRSLRTMTCFLHQRMKGVTFSPCCRRYRRIFPKNTVIW